MGLRHMTISSRIKAGGPNVGPPTRSSANLLAKKSFSIVSWPILASKLLDLARRRRVRVRPDLGIEPPAPRCPAAASSTHRSGSGEPGGGAPDHSPSPARATPRGVEGQRQTRAQAPVRRGRGGRQDNLGNLSGPLGPHRRPRHLHYHYLCHHRRKQSRKSSSFVLTGSPARRP
jgi:hypothetical protein